jgi:hypothetical protein
MMLPRKILRLAECLPLLSGLIDCSLEDYNEAVKELFSTLLIATSPIWLGAFVILICTPEASRHLIKSYYLIVIENIKRGELVIYCTTLLAPVFYLVLHDRKTERDFPSKLSSMLAAIVIWVLSGVIFAVQRTGLYFNPDIVFKISVALFVFAVIVLYLTFVYNNSRFPNVSKTFRDEEKSFSQELEKHRR